MKKPPTITRKLGSVAVLMTIKRQHIMLRWLRGIVSKLLNKLAKLAKNTLIQTAIKKAKTVTV
jgi:hypothetical protein